MESDLMIGIFSMRILTLHMVVKVPLKKKPVQFLKNVESL